LESPDKTNTETKTETETKPETETKNGLVVFGLMLMLVDVGRC